jgi:hypothetical protein
MSTHRRWRERLERYTKLQGSYDCHGPLRHDLWFFSSVQVQQSLSQLRLVCGVVHNIIDTSTISYNYIIIHTHP